MAPKRTPATLPSAAKRLPTLSPAPDGSYDISSLPHVRTTERKDFKRCQQRWWWGWRMGLKPTELKNALWFGIGMHEAWAQYYQLGYKRDKKGALEVWEAYAAEETRVMRALGIDEDDDTRHNAAALGRGMLNHYFGHYGLDRDLDIIAIERPFSILVPHPTEEDVFVAIFDGTYDGVFRHRVWKTFNVLEHKTASAISTKHLTLDPQATGYLWVATAELRHAGLLSPKQQITGIYYNFARKGLPDDRPRDANGLALNKDGTISKSQPPKFFERLLVRRTLYEIQSSSIHVANEVEQMEDLKSGRRQLTKNPTRDCSFDCSFFELCELHEAGQDYEEFKEALFRAEDPYADHRKSTDG